MAEEEEDTNVSSLCPVLLLNSPEGSPVDPQRGSALPTYIPLPHSHERRLRGSDPAAKGNLLLSVLLRLPAWRTARRGNATQRRVSQLCMQSSRGCRQGLQLA